MKAPHEYGKRQLIAVSGLSPQIVTETLYSLAIKQKNPFVPTDVHLITTTIGAKEASLQLLHPATGRFHALCKDYQLQGINFTEKNIHIIKDQQGKPLEDIKTPAQNEAAADFITAIVSQLTRDKESAIHVSIAGGRKTMGYYLGYALSLYGRVQDRLSHVLVTDKYENLKDFFYPTADSQVIHDRDGRSLDAKDAQVMLAEIPFVRLRDELPRHLQDGKTSFSESVKFAQQLESQPQLKVNRQQQTIAINGEPIQLTNINYAFYLWLLARSEKDRPIRRMSEYDNNLQYAKEFMQIYQRTITELKDDDRTQTALKQGMSSQWLSERISAVRKSIVQSLGEQAAKVYWVQRTGRNNNIHYHLLLTEDAMHDDNLILKLKEK